MKRIGLLIVLLLAGSHAWADQTIKTQNLDLRAKKISFDLETGLLVATGNANLSTTEGKIRAKSIRAVMSKSGSELQNAIAEGDVKIAMSQQPGRTINASGAKMNYTQADKLLKMSGDVNVDVIDSSTNQTTHLSGSTASLRQLASGNSALDASGNAKLITPDRQLQADQIKAEITKSSNQIDQANADGNVKALIKDKSGRIIHLVCSRTELISSQNKANLYGDVSVQIHDPSLSEPASLTGSTASIQTLASGDTVIEASGGSHLKTQDRDIKANEIHATVDKASGKVDQAIAEGNVVAKIKQEQDRVVDANCARAELFSGQNKVLLTGKVAITVTDPTSLKEPAHLTGERATVYFAPSRRIVVEGNNGQTEMRIRPKTNGKKK